jgi:phosphate transport system substrate-binding protein
LRLHGSNTIGAQLGPALAKAFFQDQGAKDIRVVPSKNDETAVEAEMSGSSLPRQIEIEAHGSATAFTGYAGNLCDIGMASRKINANEVAQLSRLGDMTSPSSEHVLGLDGSAVIVNASNPIQSLTRDRIADMFAGSVTNWEQVLGSRGTIHVYARNSKSGTYDTFQNLVLGSRSLVATAARIEDSRELSDRVAADPDGIGFVGLPYIRNAKAVAVSDAGTKPLLPTRLTVSTEDYVLSRRLYLYTPARPANALTPSFIAFALSRTEQEIIADNGFVPLIVQAEAVAVASVAPAEYRRLTSGAERLSLHFRFRSGSAELDNKAIADLDHVIASLNDLKLSAQNVMLFGFADSSGAHNSNTTLSQDRAQAVADGFAPYGLTTKVVTGFGSAMPPVASNATPEGREKNRRVEIWVKG